MPTKKSKPEVKVKRRDGDRRKSSSMERRKEEVAVVVERRQLERRVKVSRRRQIDPTTCEREYSDAEVEFMNAFNEYKRTSGRMFPTCSEILEVLTRLGYRKEMPIVVTAETAELAAARSLMLAAPEMPPLLGMPASSDMPMCDSDAGDINELAAW